MTYVLGCGFGLPQGYVVLSIDGVEDSRSSLESKLAASELAHSECKAWFDEMQKERDEARAELTKVYHDKGVWEETSAIHAKNMRMFQSRAEKAEADLARVTTDRDEWKEATIDANTRFKIAEGKVAALTEANDRMREALKKPCGCSLGQMHDIVLLKERELACHQAKAYLESSTPNPSAPSELEKARAEVVEALKAVNLDATRLVASIDGDEDGEGRYDKAYLAALRKSLADAEAKRKIVEEKEREAGR